MKIEVIDSERNTPLYQAEPGDVVSFDNRPSYYLVGFIEESEDDGFDTVGITSLEDGSLLMVMINELCKIHEAKIQIGR